MIAGSGYGIVVGGFDSNDVEGQTFGAAIDLHRAAGRHMAFQDLFGDGIFEQPLDGAAQRPRAGFDGIAFLADMIAGAAGVWPLQVGAVLRRIRLKAKPSRPRVRTNRYLKYPKFFLQPALCCRIFILQATL